jgi:hypothetical protein
MKKLICLVAILACCSNPNSSHQPINVVTNYAPPECPDQSAHIVNVVPWPGWTALNAWAVAVYNSSIISSNPSIVRVAYLEVGYGLNGVETTLLKDYNSWTDYDGGLFYRNPWCGGNIHTPLLNVATLSDGSISFDVSQAPTKIWHFWSSWRQQIPAKYDYVYTRMQVQVSGSAVIQLGGDWYMSDTCLPVWDSSNVTIATSDWYGDPDGTNGWKTLYVKNIP